MMIHRRKSRFPKPNFLLAHALHIDFRKPNTTRDAGAGACEILALRRLLWVGSLLYVPFLRNCMHVGTESGRGGGIHQLLVENEFQGYAR